MVALLLEYWKPIHGFEDHYEISILGHIRRTKTSAGARAGKSINWKMLSNGYACARLCVDGKQHYKTVHRLVMATFVFPCPEGLEVNHKDSDRGNPRLSNLEYVTSSGNKVHALDRMQSMIGKRRRDTTLEPFEVLEIRRLAGTVLQKEIAERYGVVESTVSAIVNRKKWGWLEGE